MNDTDLTSLHQELRAIDERISALNAQIQDLCWRRSAAGERRQQSDNSESISTGAECNTRTAGDERRVSTEMRLASLRVELAEALQRYLVLQPLTRAHEQHLSR